MILEGLVTSLCREGVVNLAPMGPQVDTGMNRFVLRPFRTARTYLNLKEHPQGVFHVTDDVLLIARAMLGLTDPPPAYFPARRVRGQVLAGACRYYEFRVRSMDDREERASIDVEVLNTGRLRDFFGFNRAKHAVIEAAILASRTALLPLDVIAAEFSRLAPLVDKTGGEAEHHAFALLRDHVERFAAKKSLQSEDICR